MPTAHVWLDQRGQCAAIGAGSHGGKLIPLSVLTDRSQLGRLPERTKVARAQTARRGRGELGPDNDPGRLSPARCCYPSRPLPLLRLAGRILRGMYQAMRNRLCAVRLNFLQNSRLARTVPSAAEVERGTRVRRERKGSGREGACETPETRKAAQTAN
jgi:hypothetical protein